MKEAARENYGVIKITNRKRKRTADSRYQESYEREKSCMENVYNFKR